MTTHQALSRQLLTCMRHSWTAWLSQSALFFPVARFRVHRHQHDLDDRGHRHHHLHQEADMGLRLVDQLRTDTEAHRREEVVSADQDDLPKTTVMFLAPTTPGHRLHKEDDGGPVHRARARLPVPLHLGDEDHQLEAPSGGEGEVRAIALAAATVAAEAAHHEVDLGVEAGMVAGDEVVWMPLS